MAVTQLDQIHFKIGTKAQYDTKKATLDDKTLAMTPLASEFTSNTDAGTGKFLVAGTAITTLAGTVGEGKNEAVGDKTTPVYLENGIVKAIPFSFEVTEVW